MDDRNMSYVERVELAFDKADEDSPIWYEDDKCVGEVKLYDDIASGQDEEDDFPAIFIEDCTGAILVPGNPQECEGNGNDARYECCCDECDYYQLCEPYINKS